MTPRFEARDAGRRFRSGSGDDIVALDGVSVAVPAGGFLLLTGPSGSGKTTLLALLGTLERPGSGTVLVDGVDVAALTEQGRSAARRRIGFAFPGGPMLARLPLWENLTLGLVPAGVPVAQRRERARALLARVGLEGRLRAAAEELSTGERQRAVLARALAAEPDALLVDEPLAGLDAASAAQVVEVLRTFHAAGGTLIVASHETAPFDFATERLDLRNGRRVDGSS